MAPSIALSHVVTALQFGNLNERAFLDPHTGQILRQRDEAKSGANSSENADALLPDGCEWLPALTEQEELAFAHRFTAGVAKPEDRRRLELALARGKAYEAFETTVFRCQIANAWYSYRDRCLVQFAKDWLDARNLSYTDDVTSPAE
jgi:Uncharacterised protein family (UPF0158)